MKGFTFALDPVLRQREQVEAERRREVEAIETARRELEDAIRREQGMIRASQDDQRGSMVGAIDMGDLRDQAATGLGAMRRAGRLAVKLYGLHQALETARARLVEAARDRRSIELLREQRHEAWRRERDRREGLELDEIATEAWRRERAERTGESRRS